MNNSNNIFFRYERNYKVQFFLLVFLFYTLNNTYAQKSTIDSLQNEYEKASIVKDKVKVLVGIANYYRSQSIDSLEFYVNELKSVSNVNNFYKGKVEFYLLNAILESKQKNDSLLLDNLAKASQLAFKNNDFELEARANMELYRYFFYEKGEKIEALKYLLLAEVSLSKTEGLYRDKITNLNAIAYLYIKLLNNELALKYLMKSIHFVEGIHTSKVEINRANANTYNILGMFYSDTDEDEKALYYLTLSKDTYKENNSKEGALIPLLNLGIANFNKGDLNASKSIFNSILKQNIENYIFPEKGMKKSIGLVCNLYLGKIFYKEGQYEAGALYLNEVIKNSFDESFIEFELEALEALAILQYKKGAFQNALATIAKIESKVKDENFEYMLETAYLLKSDIYEDSNQISYAYDAYKKGIELKAKINDENNKFSTEALKLAFEQEIANNKIKEQKKVIETLNEKDKIKSRSNIFLSLGLLMLVIFSVFSYIRYRKNNRLNQEKWLAEKKVEELKQNQLNLEVNYRKQQTTDFAMHISEKNDLLEKIKRQIIKADVEDENSTIKTLLFFINDDIKRNEVNTQLYTNVDEGNEAFYKNLSVKYPELTDKEKRIASLIRLGYSSKRISFEMNIAKVSIDNYRSILRKKLGLERSQNLSKFIKEL